MPPKQQRRAVILLTMLAPLASASAPLAAAELSGEARVVDGDTVVVQGTGAGLRVRLYGIDAPEAKQVCS